MLVYFPLSSKTYNNCRGWYDYYKNDKLAKKLRIKKAFGIDKSFSERKFQDFMTLLI